MAIEFSKKVGRIPTYPAAAGYGDADRLVLLASNESPDPPLRAVVDAATRALGGVNRYPDPGAGRLRSKLADRYEVPANRIAVGNGSCDVLLAAGEALLEEGAEFVYSWPSFSVYPQVVAETGATAVTVPLDAEHRHDLDAMAAAVTVATRLLVVCNPNNPTSTAVPVEDIVRLLERVPPYVCVIVDEAYCEFNLLDGDPDVTIDLLARHPNLALLRTFSKIHGLCGLRVGFALCGDERLRQAVDQVRQPFHTNAVAQAAAVEALRHEDEVTARVERAVAARLEYEERAAGFGLTIADSQANFCWLGLPDAADEAEVVAGLARQGVIVRAGEALGGPGHLRVTYGTPDQNRAFFDALPAVLS